MDTSNTNIYVVLTIERTLNKKRDCRFTHFPLKMHRNATNLTMNISEFINDNPMILSQVMINT